MRCQSRFDARYWMLGASALGRPRGRVWGDSPLFKAGNWYLEQSHPGKDPWKLRSRDTADSSVCTCVYVCVCMRCQGCGESSQALGKHTTTKKG